MHGGLCFYFYLRTLLVSAATKSIRMTLRSVLAAEELVSGPAARAITTGSTSFLGVACWAASCAEGCGTVPVATGGSGAIFFSVVTSRAVGEEVFECSALVGLGVCDCVGVVRGGGHDTDGGEEGESDEVELHFLYVSHRHNVSVNIMIISSVREEIAYDFS